MSGGEATVMPVVIVVITVFAFDRLMISGFNQLLTASRAGQGLGGIFVSKFVFADNAHCKEFFSMNIYEENLFQLQSMV